MKKILENMIIKWHQAGYALDEIAPLVPQCRKPQSRPSSTSTTRRTSNETQPVWNRVRHRVDHLPVRRTDHHIRNQLRSPKNE